MLWIDTIDIAIELSEKYPEINPLTINFVDLKNMVIGLDDFADDKNKVNERILEAIQMQWIDECS